MHYQDILRSATPEKSNNTRKRGSAILSNRLLSLGNSYLFAAVFLCCSLHDQLFNNNCVHLGDTLGNICTDLHLSRSNGNNI